MQVYEETERQWKNGNLVRVYADIQGERLTFEAQRAITFGNNNLQIF